MTGGIVSGKVNNAKIDVMVAVTKACEDAAKDGDWYPGPVSMALDALIAAVRAEQLAPRTAIRRTIPAKV
jgi:hypothetical protein